MILNRNLDLNLAVRQVRILNGHINRTINILTRSNDDLAVLVNLDRDVLAILILSGDLGVVVLVLNLDTRILRIISRINSLHIGIINRGLCSFNVEGSISASNNAALGLRVALVVLYRVAVLIKNRNLQFLVTHDDWELEGLASLVSGRLEGHHTGLRVNLDLILLDALRQLAELKLSLLRLGFLRLGFWVVELRFRGSLFVGLRINWLVLEVVTGDCKSVQCENQIVLRIWLAVSNLQTSRKRITRLSIRRNLELTARDLGCGVSLDSITLLDRIAALVKPLNVVVQVIRDRKASSIGLDLVTELGPVVRSVLINNVELQGLRSKRDVPASVATSSVTNESTITTEELRVSTSLQITTEARTSPLAKRPRVQHTNVVRQRLTVLAKNADVAPMHIDVLGVFPR